MRRSLVIVAAALAAGAVGVPSAHAGYFPGATVDGPSTDVGGVGGVALSRDGGGHVVYTRRESGATHVFVSLLANGEPRQSQRVDVGQNGASSQPRVAVADKGRALVTWVNDGSLYGALRPNGASPWGEPRLIYDGSSAPAANPDLSMTTHGAAYVVFTVGGDARAARLSGDAWTLIAQPLDVDPLRTASQPHVSGSADGTAIASFTERDSAGFSRVYVRRIVRNRLSEVPQEANVANLSGVAGGSADSSSVDIEDDSSYAWVVFRQEFGGVSRVLSRRLVGSQLGEPAVVDGNAGGAEAPSFDMTGRGRGLVGVSVAGTGQTIAAPLRAGDEWAGGMQLSSGSSAPTRPVAAIAENGRGTVAWFQPDPTGAINVVGRYYNARAWSDPVPLGGSGFGAVDPDGGLAASADGSGNQAIAFTHVNGDERRVVVALFDKEPRTTGGSNRNTWSPDKRPRFDWSRIEDSWGAITYRLDLNGVPQTTLTGTRWTPPTDLPDGAHVWNVVAIDSRGQATEGPDRAVRVDTRRPDVELTGGRAKRGRPIPLTITARDGEALVGSGISSVQVSFGNGARTFVAVPRVGFMEEKTLGYRYPRPGRYTVRVTVKDKAGNERIAKTQLRITK